MNIDLIKIGQKLKIVGSKGGCGDMKCNLCERYPEHEIIVTKINPAYIDGYNLYKKEICCYFNPDDLELMKMSWREYYKDKK